VTKVFLARQPIVDRDQAIAGYELLYPMYEADPPLGEVADEEALATARVAVNALSDIGLDRLVSESRAWINISPGFVRLGLTRNLPPERVVLQLPGPLFADGSMLELVAELRRSGYRLALSEFRYAPELDRLLEMVDMVKLDIVALGAREIARHSFQLARYGVKLVAEKVETIEDFKLAVAAGADLFQGYFFCHPQMITGRVVAPSRLALMRLAAALRDPEIELHDLERLIAGDVALSYRLLKYINSAYFGLRGQISSIQQAVALLGIERLRDWATLTVFEKLGDKPRELFVTALIRAHFCQQAGRAQDGSPAERFTLGLFSVLDALNDTPMRTALEGLPITSSMRGALIEHTGPGRLLACVTAIEQGDFEQATAIVEDSSEHYLESVAWSSDAAKQLIG
jgi:EAL and modified HD-GYP domain-containing signal transduction protein